MVKTTKQYSYLFINFYLHLLHVGFGFSFWLCLIHFPIHRHISLEFCGEMGSPRCLQMSPAILQPSAIFSRRSWCLVPPGAQIHETFAKSSCRAGSSGECWSIQKETIEVSQITYTYKCRYYIILYHTISYYIILYHTISYYIILYNIAFRVTHRFFQDIWSNRGPHEITVDESKLTLHGLLQWPATVESRHRNVAYVRGKWWVC